MPRTHLVQVLRLATLSCRLVFLDGSAMVHFVYIPELPR